MGYDVIFVGGGLSAGLAALALLERRPDASFAIVEQGAALGGNHTWCFHAADVPASAEALVAPLTVARWDGYQVRFPHRERRLASRYACVTSERLDQVVTERVAQSTNGELRLGARVRHLDACSVTLDDGTVLTGKLVVDARGPELAVGAESTGYQKFVGLELDVEPGHAITEPLVIDACIEQHDGFRFMYVLPLAPDRVLVEDTFFSETLVLNDAEREAAIFAYARDKGLCVRGVVRKERGLLPMPWLMERPQLGAGPVRAGYRGGLFHPVTGYSFPLAVRFAEALAASELSALAGSPLEAFVTSHAAQLGFLCTLTKLMFTCFEPERRYGVLEHFYRLPEPLIARFYAAQLTGLDRARIFMGAPPRGFSFLRALKLAPAEVTP